MPTRKPGESVSDCVSRAMSIIDDEISSGKLKDLTQDQRLGRAYGICRKVQKANLEEEWKKVLRHILSEIRQPPFGPEATYRSLERAINKNPTDRIKQKVIDIIGNKMNEGALEQPMARVIHLLGGGSALRRVKNYYSKIQWDSWGDQQSVVESWDNYFEKEDQAFTSQSSGAYNPRHLPKDEDEEEEKGFMGSGIYLDQDCTRDREGNFRCSDKAKKAITKSAIDLGRSKKFVQDTKNFIKNVERDLKKLLQDIDNTGGYKNERKLKRTLEEIYGITSEIRIYINELEIFLKMRK